MNITAHARSLRRCALLFALIAITAPTARAATDPGARHHHPDVFQPSTRIVTVVKSDGFHWADAGVGAGSALGAVLVVAGFGVLFMRPARPLTKVQGV